MAGTRVSVWHDNEGDMLKVLWGFREGYFTSTDDERILKRLDDDGEVIGFLIHEMSTLKQPEPVEFELASESPADGVANVTVKQAAIRLGVSERRVRQLARDGRVKGATKAGAEWLTPMPIDVIPGKRDPAGVGGRRRDRGLVTPGAGLRRGCRRQATALGRATSRASRVSWISSGVTRPMWPMRISLPFWAPWPAARTTP